MQKDEEVEKAQYCPAVDNCVTKAYQVATICVPVTVTPFANIGSIITECCGRPVISKHNMCKGVENGSCKFTITQKVKVEIPFEFGANTIPGGTFVDCECMPREDEIEGMLESRAEEKI